MRNKVIERKKISSTIDDAIHIPQDKIYFASFLIDRNDFLVLLTYKNKSEIIVRVNVELFEIKLLFLLLRK